MSAGVPIEPGVGAPPPPATRTLAVVLREALDKGEEVRLIVAKALADSGQNANAYLNVEIEGQQVTIPKLAATGLGGSASGYPVYVLATKDFMLAVGTVAASSAAATGGGLIPIGGIIEWPTASAPAGWLALDGSSFSSATYPQLAAVLGTTTLPDHRRRVPVGAGSGFAVGTSDGQPEANRNISHHHGLSGGVTSTAGDHGHAAAGGHAHGMEGGAQVATTVLNTGTRGTAATTFYLVSGSIFATDVEPDHTHPNAGNHTHALSGNTSGGTPSDGPSFIVLNFIIRAL